MMKQGTRPGTEMRCELLKICMEMGMSASSISKITKPMRGKTDEEKEHIAQKLITELKSKQAKI